MILADEAATLALGRTLAGLVRAGDAVTLSGGLGAGKTTLARGLIAALGFGGEVPSPSFPLLIPYAPPEVRLPVAHVDLYRIEPGDDLIELGLSDARMDGLLLVEWPEHGAGDPALSGALALGLEAVDGWRRLTAAVPPSWEQRWPPR